MQLDHAIDLLPKNWGVTRREGRRKKAGGLGITVRANKGRLIQKRFLSTVLEVFMPRGSRLRDERSTRGYLRKPLGRTITCTQVDLSRILLAYNDEGCASLCPVLRQMPEIQ